MQVRGLEPATWPGSTINFYGVPAGSVLFLARTVSGVQFSGTPPMRLVRDGLRPSLPWRITGFDSPRPLQIRCAYSSVAEPPAHNWLVFRSIRNARTIRDSGKLRVAGAAHNRRLDVSITSPATNARLADVVIAAV